MTNPADTTISTPPPPYEHSGSAPFIYCDGSGAYGVMNGAIQIELASRILIPRADGGTDVKFVTTGHLRCSPAAAKLIREAIDGALKMLEQPNPTPAVAGIKLN
jgi:hypothetical protein